MKISDRGIELLKELEGVSYTVYNDVAGLPTLGCGHLLTKSELTSGKIYANGNWISYREGPLTDIAVDAILRHDLASAESAVENFITVPLEQHQFDCLVIFCFNIGSSAFANSTLRKRLNAGVYNEVPTQLRRWVFAGGKRIQGLVNRRRREIELWEGKL